MRAVALLVQEGRFRDGRRAGQPIADHVNTIAVPGLGTGVGRVPPDIFAGKFKL